MDKTTPYFLSAELARALYARAASGGMVPPIAGKRRGRPRVEWQTAAKVAATVAEGDLKKTAKLLEKTVPAQARGGPEARDRRLRRYITFDKAHRAAMLRPVTDEEFCAPEARLARLEYLIRDHVGLAYEQWVRVEKKLSD